MKRSRYKLICPGCGIIIYPKHGNRQYCSTNCYNWHYNKIERDRSSSYLTALDHNVKILQSLLEGKNEIILPYSEFEKHGFDFRTYSKRTPLKNNNFIFQIEFGPYITNLTTEKSFKIKLK